MITLNIDPFLLDGNNNPPETQTEGIVVVNPEGNWHLYNQGSLELTRDSDEEYISLWSDCYSVSIPPRKVLIVGGGDYQLVKNLFTLKDMIDIVDPSVKEYHEWHKLYLYHDYEGHKRLVQEIPKTFGEFLKTYYNTVYDIVLTDVSEPILGITDEIYLEEYFINLLKLNCDTFMMYIPSPVYDELVPKLRKHFDMVSSKGKFIKDWNEHCDVILFKRKQR